MEFFCHKAWERPHDGVKVVLKRFLKKFQLNVNGQKLQNVEDVVNLSHIHLSSWFKTSYKGERKLVT
jgi:hypothetical protein